MNMTGLRGFFILMATMWRVQSWGTNPPPKTSVDKARRGVISAVLASSVIGTTSCVSLANEPQGLVSVERARDLLHPIPTFTLVDSSGVPFMVVGEDAKVTGYFFTTYGEAKRILDLAKASANKAIREAKAEAKDAAARSEIGSNPWSEARILSVPLDFAVTLASKSTKSAYFRIAPAESDIEDALNATKKDDLAEGKVPMFYFADFVVNKDGKEMTPLYFRKAELLQTWDKTNPGTERPEVLVTELFSVLTEMLKPGGTDVDLKDLFFVAPEESERRAKDCKKSAATYQIGQRIVVL
jgi:hypothetical protein